MCKFNDTPLDPESTRTIVLLAEAHEAPKWWDGKKPKERNASKAAIRKLMAEAFARGRSAGNQRPKEVVAALTSPKIKALLAEVAEGQLRKRERFDRAVSQPPTRSKSRPRKSKPRG